MLFYLTSRIVSSVGAFLYPGYASYKTLSQRPASEEELERWLMYWSVLGCIIGVEYVAEWLVSWIPFYYTAKLIFLLYLALPQTRGSSYIYINHLQPFFHSHETQIDAAIASLKSKVYSFLQERLRALWDHVAAVVGQQQSQPAGAANTNPSPIPTDAASGPAQLVSSLWRSYGPGIIASGAALLRQSAPPLGSQPTLATPPGSNFRSNSGASIASSQQQILAERRRQLEAELAALQNDLSPPTPPPVVPMPGASPQTQPHPSRASSSSDVRERTMGKFEEVEVPSDAEGYDISDNYTGHGQAGSEGKPSLPKRRSWFGWGGSPGAGYERVKSD